MINAVDWLASDASIFRGNLELQKRPKGPGFPEVGRLMRNSASICTKLFGAIREITRGTPYDLSLEAPLHKRENGACVINVFGGRDGQVAPTVARNATPPVGAIKLQRTEIFAASQKRTGAKIVQRAARLI